MRESEVEAYLHRQVRALGGRSYKMAPTIKGMPDRLVLLPGGHTLLVELKTKGGRVSPAQQLWHTRAAQCGVQVAVLSSKEEVDLWLDLWQARRS